VLRHAKWVPLVGLRSVRLGPGRRLARCPVDKHWRMTTQVDPTELAETQRAEADHHHAGLQ
jgi:hypothetical protein